MIFCTSCDKFSFSKNKNVQVIDTIVDFTSVDTFPSFKDCDSFIDKIKKQDCFRNTIHQKIGEELQKHTFSIKDSIDTTVLVDLIINVKGEIVFDGLQSSQVNAELPELENVIRSSIDSLPTVLPAVKRGIPVTTKYQLPIRIKL
ncbi:hypothetical protein [Polaribacter reichenbachii]|nr:hypothetical protein [Polaribacter reichenbachii]